MDRTLRPFFMEKDEIRLGDIYRILIGDAPPVFLLEVFIRTLIVYTALMVTLRLLGKRMNGNATVMEMAVILTLGAIVSVPMQAPERGLLLGIMILVIVVLFHRGVNWLGFKYGKFEKLIQGRMALLIKDGIIQTKQTKACSIPNQQLFSVLRSKEIYHLGQVKRMYIEACGAFSVFKNSEEKPGLSALPLGVDSAIAQILHEEPNMKACVFCGTLENTLDTINCGHCGTKSWAPAVKTPNKEA